MNDETLDFRREYSELVEKVTGSGIEAVYAERRFDAWYDSIVDEEPERELQADVNNLENELSDLRDDIEDAMYLAFDDGYDAGRDGITGVEVEHIRRNSVATHHPDW